MKDCEEKLLLMSLYIDDELNDKEKENFLNHIKQCSCCKKELEEMEKVILELRNLEEIELPEGFHQELILKINVEKNSRLKPKVNFKRYTLYASVALIVISIGVLLSSLPQYNANEEEIVPISQPMQAFVVEDNFMEHIISLNVENIEEISYIINNLPGNTLVLSKDEYYGSWVLFQKEVNINYYEYIKNEIQKLGAITLEEKNFLDEDITNIALENEEEIIYMFITIEQIY